MAFRNHLRAAAAMAVLVVVATVHGEGSQHESLRDQLAQARAALARAHANDKAALTALAPEAPPDDPEVPVPNLPNGCPQDETAWKTWMLDTVPFLLQLAPPDDTSLTPFLAPADVSIRASQIKAVLALCKEQKSEPPASLLPNLQRFIESRANADSSVPNAQHQLAHGISDDQFLCRAKPALEIPCLLRSQTFLRAMSSPSTYKDALALIDAQNHNKPIAECVGDPGVSPDAQWKTLTYRSRFLTTPDHASTLGRLLVVAPAPAAVRASGVAYDRWVQFGIWTPDDPQRESLHIHNLSVVAVSTGSTPSYDAMVDWFRCQGDDCKPERSWSGSTLVNNGCQAPLPTVSAASAADGALPIELRYRRAITGDGDECQSCHKAVPLSVHPTAVYDFTQDPPATDNKPEENWHLHAIDDLFFSPREHYQRPPVWQTGPDDKLGNPDDYGAYPLGVTPDQFGLGERTDEYLKACALPYKLPDNEVYEMRRGMDCADCHNGRDHWFGKINYPQATETRRVLSMSSGQHSLSNRNLVKAYIMGGIMPHGTKLSLSEDGHDALYRCLSKEYYDHDTKTGLLVDWLEDDGAAPGGPAAKLADAHPRAPKTLVAATTPTLVAGAEASKTKAFQAPVDGKAVFDQRCARCHSLRAGDDGDRKGPSLAGILKHAPAHTRWKYYSDGLHQVGHDGKPWTDKLLMDFLVDQDAFLAKHTGKAQQSGMNALYPDPEVRRALVNYLAAQH